MHSIDTLLSFVSVSNNYKWPRYGRLAHHSRITTDHSSFIFKLWKYALELADKLQQYRLWTVPCYRHYWSDCSCSHCAKKPVTIMLTYPWKCTVLHCNHLGTWKPLVLITRHFDYCPSASEGDNQSVRSSAPVVSRCFPGGFNVKLYISRGKLAWWLLAFLHCQFLVLAWNQNHDSVPLADQIHTQNEGLKLISLVGRAGLLTERQSCSSVDDNGI